MASTNRFPDDQRLALWEWLLLACLFITTLVFGAIVELRSAYMQRRMTDLDVYLRAAWAVRTGGDIYTITDDNDWHYHYPPLFAILMTPLADPPAGADQTGMIPFAVSVALWYMVSVGFVVAGIHLLARALESAHGSAFPNRTWWRVRTVPLVTCLAPIGHTLTRGQVNHLLLFLLCASAAAVILNKRWQAGAWLAGAICLKVIPAFLLIYPLWRRDWRFLLGCSAGLVVGLAIIPGLVFGPAKTLALYQEWDEVLRQPALGSGNGQSRAKELLDVTATDSQSFLAIVHNSLNADRTTRPTQATERVRQVHWFLVAVFTGLTLLAAGRRPLTPPNEVVFFGLLVMVMIVASPVAHLHYFTLSAILILGLHVRGVEGGGWRVASGRTAWYGWLALYFAAQLIPNLPGMEATRDFGLAMYSGLAMWLIGCLALVFGPTASIAAKLEFNPPLHSAA